MFAAQATLGIGGIARHALSLSYGPTPLRSGCNPGVIAAFAEHTGA
jgi:hypothetical protein